MCFVVWVARDWGIFVLPSKKKNEEKTFFSDFYFLFFLVFGLQRKCESLLGCAESGGKEEKMEGFYFYSFFSWFILF